MVQRPAGGDRGGSGGRDGRARGGGHPAGWEADAQTAATQYYASLHTNLLTQMTARLRRTGPNVYVTVKGRLGYSVFPFFALNLNISATAGGPVECFRPAGQNGC